jgi:hypothetical protein
MYHNPNSRNAPKTSSSSMFWCITILLASVLLVTFLAVRLSSTIQGVENDLANSGAEKAVAPDGIESTDAAGSSDSSPREDVKGRAEVVGEAETTAEPEVKNKDPVPLLIETERAPKNVDALVKSASPNVQTAHKQKNSIVIIDAGSSGSRIYVYTWAFPSAFSDMKHMLDVRPALMPDGSLMEMKLEPGVPCLRFRHGGGRRVAKKKAEG